jgi:ribosomal protein S18
MSSKSKSNRTDSIDRSFLFSRNYQTGYKIELNLSFELNHFLIVNFSEFIMSSESRANYNHKKKLSSSSTIRYKNVNLLRRYITNTRKIISRYDTKWTFKKHRIITKCIRQARRVRLFLTLTI